MKTKLNISCKMHILIIVSSVLVAIGLMVGLICQFVADGFFNYGSDYESYKSVTVSYEDVDFTREEMTQICTDAFNEAGVNNYAFAFGNGNTGGELIYKFTTSTDDTALNNAVIIIKNKIEEAVNGDISFTTPSVHVDKTLLGGGKALSMCAIAVAVLVVLHFVYFAIRYKLTSAFGAVLADVHNLLLFLALLAITRIPVGSATFAFAALTVLITVIGTCFLFDRVRKNTKDENLSKLSPYEITDLSARESFKFNIVLPACLAGVAVLLFVLLSISSLSPLAIMSPIFCALISFISCAYGTTMFTPAVFSRIKKIGADYKLKHARPAKEKKPTAANKSEREPKSNNARPAEENQD